jgi:hypothetical protein
MSPELDAKLCAKYPTIFVNRGASPQESCMHWGLEVSDGWYDLIDGLCESLTNLYTTGVPASEGGGDYVSVDAPRVVADQVKTKYATLRFYSHLVFDPVLVALLEEKNPAARHVADGYQSYVDGIIHHAETLSARTCEVTGRPGELHVSGGSRYGWYATLNREFARTDPDHVKRGYVPVADLPEETQS